MRRYNGLPVYEVGTRVRLTKSRQIVGQTVNTNSSMRSQYGKEFVISEVDLNGGYPRYRFEGSEWVWDNSFIEGEVEPYDDGEELEDASFGNFFSGFTVNV